MVSVNDDGRISLAVDGWPGLRIPAADTSIACAGRDTRLLRRTSEKRADGSAVVTDEYEPGLVIGRKILHADAGQAIVLESELTNASGTAVELTDVALLRCTSGISLGRSPDRVRLYEQGSYWSRVRPLTQSEGTAETGAEQDRAAAPLHSSSQYAWLAWDGEAHMALLVGFETGERWTGIIETSGPAASMPSLWRAGLAGGHVLVQPGQTVELETLSIMAGDDPWALLCRYGDRVGRRHGVRVPSKPPVSWCSWYPYRLGVSDERVLATARIAAERLRPLGLRIILLDLGWQEGYLPSAFRENDQFPRGLAALASDLEHMGFLLGAWCAPFTISDHDPLAREHPEWLLGAEPHDGSAHIPQPLGEWFWEPHGQTYALDLTHPGAQEWLRTQMRSLSRRGVRYLKPDFMSGALSGALTGRHDRAVVAGGGAEAVRIGMDIMLREIAVGQKEAWILNCGGPDIPGKGAMPLLYTCDDTGNTGFVGWKHLEEDYGRKVAGHLWKNRRWGIIQPSCMVVGLSGTVEEARLRATATFLAGGQVDIGDNLTNLPEDRWQILLATLPPLGVSARPVDLFEPLEASTLAYDASTGGRGGEARKEAAEGVSRVWVLSVDGEWDRWKLVGLFNYDTNDNVPYGKARITTFKLPLERLGIEESRSSAVLEFWSQQYLGASPFDLRNPHGYRHPGDAQGLIVSPSPAMWEVSFFGPSVKLLIIREARQHPWPVGTTFHQSGGMELQDVSWRAGTLSGTLHRPPGQSGSIIIAAGGAAPRDARAGRRKVPWHSGASGSIHLPVVTESDTTRWQVRF